MYNGYVEPEEKVEERKRRILGKAAPSKESRIGHFRRWMNQPITTATGIKQVLLMIAILYPIAFLLGSLIGDLIRALVR